MSPWQNGVRPGAPSGSAAPDDQRVVEQSALLKVFDQRGARLVGVAALDFKLRRRIAVMVPAGVEALHEPHAPLDQPPSHQAVVRERSLPSDVRAVAFEDVLRLGGEIGQFRDAGLHLVGHLVLSDPRDDLRVADLLESIQVISDEPPPSCSVAVGDRLMR